MSANNTESPELDQIVIQLLEQVKEHGRHEKAWLERKIKDWPSGWGDDFQVLIYGDFEPPDTDLHFPSLGIIVYHEKLEKTVIHSARCVLKATVTIREKSVSEITDAIHRINVLLGVWTLAEWGNVACGWWSHITHSFGGGVLTKFANQDLNQVIDKVINIPDPVRKMRKMCKMRKKINAVLYWVREPKHLMMEWHRSDLLRIYAAYWNAFECLVKAVQLLHPPPKLSTAEKNKQIAKFFTERNGELTKANIDACYHKIVDPGFRGEASYALTVCFPEDRFPNIANSYIRECFPMPNKADKANYLYNIRNAINHGEIDAENPEELLRVESRLPHLQMMVWRMFDRLLRLA
jgi:hypothetical protein